MPFPTTNAQLELPAVNEILASVGQAPVTTLNQTNPDVAICYDTLINTSRQVQAEGWSFNKEYSYPIAVDIDNHILIPNNVLQIDLAEEYRYLYGGKDVVNRNGKLYDKIAHTYKWEAGTVYCDILWLFDWVDLPTPIKDYITAKAATYVCSNIVGDKTLYQMLSSKEATQKAVALEYECNQGDYSFFGHAHGSNFYHSYQPYQALKRF